VFQLGAIEGLVAVSSGRVKDVAPGLQGGIDLDDEPSVGAFFERVPPSLIIYCAGICNVEKCETSPEFAHAVNVDGVRNVLLHAPQEARFVYCSSDHVFGGDAGPYHEDSEPAPISVYGRTRVAAERLVLDRPGSLVIRPGLCIGPSASGRVGHLDWLRYRHGKSLAMTVVEDEIRSAVWAEDAARRIVDLANSRVTGTRHIAATRAVARPQLAAYLNQHYAIGAAFGVESRAARRVPHLGNVELATRFDDALAAPLPSVMP
jgi:dTDP-4-dehydrorhamnose reductase